MHKQKTAGLVLTEQDQILYNVKITVEDTPNQKSGCCLHGKRDYHANCETAGRRSIVPENRRKN